MLKSKTLVNYKVLFAIFVSEFMQYLLSEVINLGNEIKNIAWYKMELVKVDNYWVRRYDAGGSSAPRTSNVDGVGPSDTVGKDHVEDVMHALIPYEPSIDHGIPLSQFERLMLGRMDAMAHD